MSSHAMGFFCGAHFFFAFKGKHQCAVCRERSDNLLISILQVTHRRKYDGYYSKRMNASKGSSRLYWHIISWRCEYFASVNMPLNVNGRPKQHSTSIIANRGFEIGKLWRAFSMAIRDDFCYLLVTSSNGVQQFSLQFRPFKCIAAHRPHRLNNKPMMCSCSVAVAQNASYETHYFDMHFMWMLAETTECGRLHNKAHVFCR